MKKQINLPIYIYEHFLEANSLNLHSISCPRLFQRLYRVTSGNTSSKSPLLSKIKVSLGINEFFEFFLKCRKVMSSVMRLSVAGREQQKNTNYAFRALRAVQLLSQVCGITATQLYKAIAVA